MDKIKVLFVCMGNICRSPTAEGVFRDLLEREQLEDLFIVDSAGTHAYHIGEMPDIRAQQAARERKIDIKQQRARKVVMGDFEDFDYLLVMDTGNHATLIEACAETHHNKIQYFLDYAPHLDVREVPDPYYGGDYGFERVLDLVEEASIGFIAALRKNGDIE